NQNLDQQLKTLNGLQEQRDAIIERMKLIQGLQSQRPVVVRLVDELVRVTPSAMYLTKFSRTGDKFTIEGKAESPNTVAELLRNLEASPWYRNAFMNSFLANEEKKDKAASSLLPRVEDHYGSFVVTVDLGEMGVTTTDDSAKPSTGESVGAAK
ncbi:PilN domain-containing protein, partial [Acinetobacter baumannii]